MAQLLKAPSSKPEDQKDDKKSAARRLIAVATSVAFAIGLGLLFVAKGFLDKAAVWADVFTEAGKVVLVTSVVGLIFEYLMHERFVQLVEGRVGVLQRHVAALDRSIDRLQKTVAITSGAIESGLGAVYSERQKAIDEIGGLLSRAESGEEMRLLGISLGDFLCPHGRLYGTTLQALARGVQIKALMVDLNAEAAKTRAQREENTESSPAFGSPEWTGWYHETRCYDELKTATDAAADYARRYPAKAGGNDAATPGFFDYGLYSLSPLCFLAIHKNTMFLESYHYAGRGGEAPILKITGMPPPSDHCKLFEIYLKHFDVLWRIAKDDAAKGQKDGS